jgi:hypothetical protein
VGPRAGLDSALNETPVIRSPSLYQLSYPGSDSIRESKYIAEELKAILDWDNVEMVISKKGLKWQM